MLKTQMGGVKTFFSLEHYDCLIECFVMSLKLQCIETRKQSVHQATITTDLLPLCTNGADICQSYGSNVSRTGWDWHETDLLPACQTYRIRYVKKKKGLLLFPHISFSKNQHWIQICSCPSIKYFNTFGLWAVNCKIGYEKIVWSKAMVDWHLNIKNEKAQD